MCILTKFIAFNYLYVKILKRGIAMNREINIIKSNRKSFSLEIKPNLEIICRVPNRASKKEIEDFISKHENWLEKHIEKIEENENKNPTNNLSQEEIKALSKRAKEYIPQRVEFFANQMGIEYGNITIRTQKTRWGSCSSKKNLNFNCLLMLTDLDIIDYVVVHELCHIKEMNHSQKFWAEVERVLPEYKETRRRLKEIRINF